MSDEEGDATLSITLVDGISCGLAGALLLFVIFGLNLSASTSTLGGQSGQGTVARLPSGFTTEPVDILVEVDDVNPGADPAPWASPDKVHDHIVVDAAGHRTIFIREIAEGVAPLNGDEVKSRYVSFSLDWPNRSPPHGRVHIFLSGTHTSLSFRCQQLKGPYAIITGFKPFANVVDGECW